MKRVTAVLTVFAATVGGLFCWNGLFLARAEKPYAKTTSHPIKLLDEAHPRRFKVMAYNIAKCFVHQGGISFETRDAMAARLKALADVVNAEQPDLLFLSEAVVECGPCPVNQVDTLAQATGMHSWAFGEDFNFGLPFFRIINGNAILSRQPLELVANPSLAGRRSFCVMRNNRRVLWCAMPINGQRVLLASIHTDSFNRENNFRQTQQLLAFMGTQPAILAGDFNALPTWDSLTLLRDSGRLTGEFAGPLTFPSDHPNRTLDYILAPASWRLVEHHVVQSQASDHCPVVSTFEVP